MISQARTQVNRQPRQRTWSFPRRMIDDYVGFTLLAVLAAFVVSVVVSFGIDVWGTVSTSIWESVVSSAGTWYSAVLTGIVAYTFLPVAIANGKTRWDFAVESLIYLGVFAVVSAWLIAIGFLLEWGLYAVMDWPHTFSEGSLFTSSSEVHLIFAGYLLRIALWSAAGYMVGAGFYRASRVGLLAYVAAAIPLMVSEFVMEYWYGTPSALLYILVDPPSIHGAVAYAIGLAMLAIIIGCSWLIIRNMPLRSTTE